jgi:hypothetical protein
VFDKISLNTIGPLFSKLRSFTSMTSLSRRSGSKVDQTSHSWGTEVGVASQRDLISTLPPKSSYSQPSYENIHMAAMPERDGRY